MTTPKFDDFYGDMADVSINVKNAVGMLEEADKFLATACSKLNEAGEAGESATKVLPDGITSITVKHLHRNLLFLQHQVRLAVGLTKVDELRDMVHLCDMFFPYDGDEF